jgi:preprotein translocase subunit SecB
MTDATANTATEPVKASTTTTDIEIDSISLSACHFEDHLFVAAVLEQNVQAAARTGEEGADLTTEIGVWIGDNMALVRLRVNVIPKAQPTWAAIVEYVGRYSVGPNPVLPLEKFAWNNGIAYLVPFVREKLVTLTAGSIWPTYVLPPISVPTLRALARDVDGPAQSATEAVAAPSGE